jgi:4-amino-4-deoxy-L-arabinose transferase-like glycosyltransferase
MHNLNLNLGICGLLFALAGGVLALQMPLSPLPVALWVAGMLFLVAAAWRHDARAESVPLSRVVSTALKMPAIRIELLGVSLVCLAAFLLRAWGLERFPPFMHGDEAESAWRGLRILIGPDPLPPFQTSYDWYGIPTLYHYIEAASMAVFGMSVGGVRMVSALFGAVSVPLAYGVARLNFGRVAGVFSALLMMFGHTHVHFSRLAGGFIQASTMLIMMLLLITIAARGGRRMLVFAGIGLVIGLAQYMYAATRLLPIVGGILLLALLAVRKLEVKHLLVVILATAVAIAPLGMWYLQNPQAFGGRVDDVFIFSAGALRHTLGPDYQLPRDLGKLIGLQFERVIGYLVNNGDVSTKYSSRFPGFDPSTAGLFWFGLALALPRMRRFGESMLIVWFAAGFTLAGLLTIDAPSANRLMAAIPSVYLLAGFAAQRVADGLRRLAAILGPAAQQATVAVAAPVIALVVSVLAISYNLNVAFVAYPLVSGPMAPIMTGRELAPLDGGEWRAYVMGLPAMYADYAPVRFVAYKIKANDLLRAEDLAPAEDGRKTIVVALPDNYGEYEKVKQRFPGGEEHEGFDLRGDSVFRSYRFR